MRLLSFIALAFTIGSCGGPEPRWPVEVKSGSFFKESIERNKRLLKYEEDMIEQIIEKDTLRYYLASPNGFWYYYDRKNDSARYTPRTGDQILFSYNVRTLTNDTIYSAIDLGLTSYTIDKEQLFPGLQNAVKLLKINERATFLFPSLQAYGYLGDGREIGPKTPLMSTIELHTIVVNTDSLNPKP